MSDKITTISFCEHFIRRLAEDIVAHYAAHGRDLRRIGVVFGGHRPALFLRRELARLLHGNFYPPAFFTIDEFMAAIVRQAGEFERVQDLDQCYLMYRLAQEAAPQILKQRSTFASFLPWAREILRFIEHLDLESIPSDKLRNIEANARIGYPVPPDINRLLEHMVVLRNAYHRHMEKAGVFSRGFQYLQAAQCIGNADFSQFDQILFCNFFYLHRTEETVIQQLVQQQMARIIVQGDERKWPVLEKTARRFGMPVREGAQPDTPQFDLKLYSVSDIHTEVGMVREILKGIPDREQAVIVLPQPDHLVPLLAEIVEDAGRFNISMGYPLRRSSVCTLLTLIFRCQLSRRENGYYSRDYLRLLRHPLIKNLAWDGQAAVTRVLVHKIEEALNGRYDTAVTGHLFIRLEQIISLPELITAAQETLAGMGVAVAAAELTGILEKLHALVLSQWEGLGNFRRFSAAIDAFLQMILARGALYRYPLNGRIVERILTLKDELDAVAFAEEDFPDEDLFRIFTDKMEQEIVAFHGSPLKGLQVLGLFETRALNFEHVIVMDVNEGDLPHLNIYDPLIPREVMISLNLDRLEQEEEILRYHFMRLISAARTVHLVYQENRHKERSRFVEELIWEQQKTQQSLNVLPVTRPAFAVRVRPHRREVAKTPAMLEMLRAHRYSASSINTYLRDPLEFYYSYVLGLREREDLLEEPENRQVGTFIHNFLEEVFRPLIGAAPRLDADFVRVFDARLETAFEQQFQRSMRADAFLLKSVVRERLKRFLENEMNNPDRRLKEILFIEQRFEERMTLPCGEVNFVYRLDRVDRLADGTVMILDYKTGSVDPMPKSIAEVESMPLSREALLEHIISFQIPLYFLYLDQHFPDDNVNAAFYNLRTLEVRRFIDRRMNMERERIASVFRRALDWVLSEILDPEVPFQEAEETA